MFQAHHLVHLIEGQLFGLPANAAVLSLRSMNPAEPEASEKI